LVEEEHGTVEIRDHHIVVPAAAVNENASVEEGSSSFSSPFRRKNANDTTTTANEEEEEENSGITPHSNIRAYVVDRTNRISVHRRFLSGYDLPIHEHLFRSPFVCTI